MSKNLLNKIKISGIGKMFNLANGMGGDLIRFETGDVNFPTPEHIVKEAYDEAKKGMTHYAPYKGYDTLREEVCKKLEKNNKIYKKLEEILITSGASGALFLAFQSLLNNGDEVVIPDPSWPHFAEMIKLAGGIPIEVPFITAEGVLHSELLENAINKKTKAILINSPNNPTGAVISKKELQEIAQIAEKFRITVFSDEVYESFVYGANKHFSIGSMYEDVVSVYSFSKTYAMCGWRLGYIAANPKLIERMTKLSIYSITCIPPFIQAAGLAALQGTRSSTRSMVDIYQKRRDFFVKGLNKIEGIKCPLPKGSLYAWPEISSFGKSADIAKLLLEKGKCVTVPGDAFGESGEGKLRLSLSLNENRLKEGLERIGQVMSTRLKK